MKKSPQLLASEIASNFSETPSNMFAKIVQMGPYVNAFIDMSSYAQAVLKNE
jgi:arginyl-tRNA synthetase